RPRSRLRRRATGRRLRSSPSGSAGPGGCRQGASGGNARAGLGQLQLPGNDVLERRPWTERGDVGLLDLDGLTRARVAGGASGSRALFEDTETGDRHLLAALHLPLNQVDEALDGRLGRFLV